MCGKSARSWKTNPTERSLRRQVDAGGGVEQDAPAGDDAARVGTGESRDHAQRERLARAGGSEEHRQLVADLPVDVQFEAGQARPERHGEAAHGALRTSRLAAVSAATEMPVNSSTIAWARSHSPPATAA